MSNKNNLDYLINLLFTEIYSNNESNKYETIDYSNKKITLSKNFQYILKRFVIDYCISTTKLMRQHLIKNNTNKFQV